MFHIAQRLHQEWVGHRDLCSVLHVSQHVHIYVYKICIHMRISQCTHITGYSRGSTSEIGLVKEHAVNIAAAGNHEGLLSCDMADQISRQPFESNGSSCREICSQYVSIFRHILVRQHKVSYTGLKLLSCNFCVPGGSPGIRREWKVWYMIESTVVVASLIPQTRYYMIWVQGYYVILYDMACWNENSCADSTILCIQLAVGIDIPADGSRLTISWRMMNQSRPSINGIATLDLAAQSSSLCKPRSQSQS